MHPPTAAPPHPMPAAFDPSRLPHANRLRAPAVELSAALARLDDRAPHAWRHGRAAALRFVEAARAAGLGPGFALGCLRRAVATCVSPDADAGRRARLQARLPFWVATAYGLRWREAAAAPRPAPVALAVGPAGGATRPPEPGEWARMRVWRHGLAARLEQLRHRRVQLHTSVEAGQGRAARSAEAASAHAEECRRLRAEAQGLRERAADRRLSDVAIRAIALRILRAVRRPRPVDPVDDVLSPARQLPPADEARVEAALEAMLREEAR